MPRAGRRSVSPEEREQHLAIREAIEASLLPSGFDEVLDLAEDAGPHYQRLPCTGCEKWTARADLIRALHEKGSPLYCGECWQRLATAFLPMQERSVRLNAYYRRTYNIDFQEYGERYLRQRGACLICQHRPMKPLVVDHCHKTGTVRGLLCQNCNSGLGMFRDDVAAIARAIAYLAETDRSD